APEGSSLHEGRPRAGGGGRCRSGVESQALVVPPPRVAATVDRKASSRPLDRRAQPPSRAKRAHLDERPTPAGNGTDFGHRAFLHIEQGQHQAVLRRQPGQERIDQLSRSQHFIDWWGCIVPSQGLEPLAGGFGERRVSRLWSSALGPNGVQTGAYGETRQ